MLRNTLKKKAKKEKKTRETLKNIDDIDEKINKYDKNWAQNALKWNNSSTGNTNKK